MAEAFIATRCPDCGRQLPPHEVILPVFQGCGRLAIPGPHLGSCVRTDDRGGFAVVWNRESPSAGAYARCERECQERVDGGLECRDECERSLAAGRRAARG